MGDILKIRDLIRKRIEIDFPAESAMLLKNWRRYGTLVEKLLPHLENKKQCKILDYGSGVPFITALLHEFGFNGTAFEPYPSGNAKAIATSLGLHEKYHQQLPNEDQFDVVLLIDVIEHIPGIQPFMRRATSYLKPGGILLISTPNGLRLEQWLSFLLRKRPHPTDIVSYWENNSETYFPHLREFARDELMYMVKNLNFSIVESCIIDVMPTRAELYAYRIMEPSLKQIRQKLNAKEKLIAWIKKALPESWQSNIVLIAQKK